MHLVFLFMFKNFLLRSTLVFGSVIWAFIDISTTSSSPKLRLFNFCPSWKNNNIALDIEFENALHESNKIVIEKILLCRKLNPIIIPLTNDIELRKEKANSYILEVSIIL